MTEEQAPVDQLLARIERHLAALRSDAAGGARPVRSGRLSQAVYDGIDEAGILMNATHVQPFLTAPQLPIIGPLLQRWRAAVHALVVFYVNRHAGAQAAFNREIVATLNAIVDDLDRGDGVDPADRFASHRADQPAPTSRPDRELPHAPTETPRAETDEQAGAARSP